MEYLLGLDVGTSGVKALLTSQTGEIIAEGTESYPLATPQSGWAEQNPKDWWEATKKVIKQLINDSDIDAKQIKGISFSGQMHSSVFLNDEMEVIRPAILWSDTRTTKQCREIEEKAGGLEELIGHVSNPALEGFTAPKILWLKENEPSNYEEVNYVLMPKDYIRYKLTGEIHTEVSDAAGTLLLDVGAKDWDLELVDKLEIDPDILPPVINSIDIVGQVQEDVAQEIGLSSQTSVVAGGADNACGAVGSGIVEEGRVMVSIGSSGTVVAQTNNPSADEEGRMHLFNHAQPNSWYLMGVMLSAGMSYRWLKEDLYNDQFEYDKLNQLAADVDPGSEGLIFLPYLYGERTPHADANARGVYFGISGKHSQGHFVRSLLEGVSFGLKDSLELIKEQGVEIDEVRVIGGGAKSDLWQQILADILGEEISLLNIEEGPAFGAALIAGVGVGIYDDFAEATSNILKIEKTVAPISENSDNYEKYYNLYKQLYTSLKDDFKDLAQV
ncbi:xylulokinase [Halanaerobacter jeridensis]|uniref:Xylulose kinase n=1 Tax=Halanaerobacter jeridensis TaxID=706427 RepID=A0A938XQS1_9FIRM|nr:xylulokinase [Halanaerobacter jeridensis]MBM7555655.1 xylulokinase [Halanaerobacter jeridensis]